MANPFQDFYGGILDADPELAYMGAVSDTPFMGTKPMQRKAQDYYRGKFGDMFNEYLGELGSFYKSQQNNQQNNQQSMTAQNRSVPKFTDFLSQTPFTERYASLTPYQRGMSTSRFSPSTRHIYY